MGARPSGLKMLTITPSELKCSVSLAMADDVLVAGGHPHAAVGLAVGDGAAAAQLVPDLGRRLRRSRRTVWSKSVAQSRVGCCRSVMVLPLGPGSSEPTRR